MPSVHDFRERIDLRALRRRPLVFLFLALAAIEVARLLVAPHPIDVIVLVLVGALGFVALQDEGEIAGAEGSRRSEAESFARILRGLARSVSPDAIVDAIVEELGVATGADHVAVVRRRPEGRSLEVLLSPTRVGSPTSRTSLPLSELEDPAEDEALSSLAVAASRGRRLTAVPIEPDPDGDPQLVPLGIAADRLRQGSYAAHDGLALEGSGRSAVATMPARTRTRQATPVRDGAEQRIADRIADRLRAAYGLSNVVAAPLRVERARRGGDRPLAPHERPVAGVRAPDPGGRGGRIVRRARSRVLAARGGGPGDDRRAHRPAEPALLRRVRRAPRRSAAGPRTRSAC